MALQSIQDAVAVLEDGKLLPFCLKKEIMPKLATLFFFVLLNL